MSESEPLGSCETPLGLSEFMEKPRATRNKLVKQSRREFESALIAGVRHPQPPELYLLSPIGRPSVRANVFQVCSNGARVVCKVMPTVGESAKSDLDEVVRAKMASTLAERGQCEYVLMVYDSLENVDVVMPQVPKSEQPEPWQGDDDLSSEALQPVSESEVSFNARWETSRPRVVELLLADPRVTKEQRAKLGRKRKELSSSRGLSGILDFAYVATEIVDRRVVRDAIKQALLDTPTFKATLLFGEVALAEFDVVLKNRASSNLPPRLRDFGMELRSNSAVFIRVCKQIFEGLKMLQETWGFVHGDFHLGNIMLTYDGDRIIPVIHDFGGARMVTVPPGALEKYPGLQELSEYPEASRRNPSYMTTQERTEDLTDHFFVKMLQMFEYAKETGTPFNKTSEMFIKNARSVVAQYIRAHRSDAGLFDELIALPSTLEPPTQAMAAMQLPRTLRAGYAHPYFGMKNF